MQRQAPDMVLETPWKEHISTCWRKTVKFLIMHGGGWCAVKRRNVWCEEEESVGEEEASVV